MVDCVSFDVDAAAVDVCGKHARLTDIEYSLLEALVEADGSTVCKRELIRKAWGSEMGATDETLRQHMHKLGSKVGKRHIKNMYGFGYRFE